MVWLFVAPSNWVFWLAVNMRDFEKLPIWEHSVEWNMRIGVIISDEPRINDEIRVSQVRLIGAESPVNGGRPVSISYSTQPAEYIGYLVIGDDGIDLGASQVGMPHHHGDAFH